MGEIKELDDKPQQNETENKPKTPQNVEKSESEITPKANKINFNKTQKPKKIYKGIILNTHARNKLSQSKRDKSENDPIDLKIEPKTFRDTGAKPQKELEHLPSIERIENSALVTKTFDANSKFAINLTARHQGSGYHKGHHKSVDPRK